MDSLLPWLGRYRKDTAVVAIILVGAVASMWRWSAGQRVEELAAPPPRPIFAPQLWKTETPAPSPFPGDLTFIPVDVNAGVRLVNAVMCEAVATNGLPLRPTRYFSPTAAFFCSSEALGLAPGTAVDALWKGPDGHTFSDTVKNTQDGMRVVWFDWHPKPRWSPGRYAIELSVRGTLQQRREFEVR